MARSKTGEAIRPARRTSAAVRTLGAFVEDARGRGDLEEWRRGRALQGYIEGRRVVDLAREADVTRGSVNRWLQWYDAEGVEGLRTLVPPGPSPKLSATQRSELSRFIEKGPVAAGLQSGVWTGPMIKRLIAERFDVDYHAHHVPRLLHQLGFSVQRPRKKLARADAELQATWLRRRLPAIKKKSRPLAVS